MLLPLKFNRQVLELREYILISLVYNNELLIKLVEIRVLTHLY